MLMPALASELNKRAAIPGTPNKPLPCSVSKEMVPIEEIPLTGVRESSSFSDTRVPGWLGLKVFLIHIGIFFASTGWMVGG